MTKKALIRSPAGLYSRPAKLALQGGTILGLAAAWQAAANLGIVSEFFYSSPMSILGVLTDWVSRGDLHRHIAITVAEALAGFAIGALVGASIGLTMAVHPRTGRVLGPFMGALNGIPRLMFVPFFIIALGTGMMSKVALAAFVVVFLVMFSTYAGVSSLDESVLQNARMLGARRRDLLRHVYIPAALVWVIASLRASIGFAFAAAVVGEYLGSRAGLGHLILQGMSFFRTREVLAGLAIVIVIVVAADSLLKRFEARAQVWKQA